jgi:hypothetical protein
MPTCPICKEELTEQTNEGWKCKCGEIIPFDVANQLSHSCGCGCRSYDNMH